MAGGEFSTGGLVFVAPSLEAVFVTICTASAVSDIFGDPLGAGQ
jgi:hypothetical protein